LAIIIGADREYALDAPWRKATDAVRGEKAAATLRVVAANRTPEIIVKVFIWDAVL